MDLTAETPETTVAVKAKLKVARRMLREANKHKGRVKKQGKGMAIKLKGAREAGQRVVELEREVAGLREDAAGARAAAAAAAAAGGREEEFFSMRRESTKRGEYIPLEGGGAKLHKLFAVMHDTCDVGCCVR